MGLDIDIVKFKKPDFDRLADNNRRVDYHEGTGLNIETDCLFYYRKHYCIQDMLGHVSNGRYDQCTFHELTKERLERAVKLATRLKRSEDDRWEKEELDILIRDINVILAETDFNTSVISLSWIS